MAVRRLGSPAGLTAKKCATATPYELESEVTSIIQFTECTEEPRFNVDDVMADIEHPDGQRETDVQVLDVGPGGLAAVTAIGHDRGDQIMVTLYGFGEAVQFGAEIRGIAPLGADTAHVRTGIKIRQIDRLNAARWKRFYAEIVELNRAVWAPETSTLVQTFKARF